MQVEQEPTSEPINEERRAAGARLRAFRESLKMTQTDFGALFDLKQPRYSLYENGERLVPTPIGKRIAAMAKEHGYPLSFEDLYP